MTNRRSFLKQVAGGAVGLGLFPSVEPMRGPLRRPEDAAYEAFVDPPAEARPFFRWWWNGNRITEEHLLRELRVMHAAGAGGVEVNPIALHETIENPTGAPVPWLSDEWNRLLRSVADEAGRLGMYVDLIVGTGWPFGGRFLSDEETIQGLEVEATPLTGPTVYTADLSAAFAPHHELRQVRLVPSPVPDPEAGVDLTASVAEDGKLRVEVPAGPHVLYVLTWRNRFRDVMFGAPGADGPALDHFNRAAVERYLSRMSDALGPVLGGRLGDAIRSVFCDSIELEGANWTGDFAEVFRARRGYSVRPWLPLILDPEPQPAPALSDRLRRARYDYARTLAELFEERFIRPFHAWCQRQGVRSRYQAYGYPWIYTDLLDGYLIPDIPEGDQWLFNRGWIQRVPIDQIRYAIWNKYASSGGHLRGRPVISSEAMTNTRGVFEASLEYVKQATDVNVATGINHLVLHGYNYSPPEAGFPGWMRFGAYFSPQNPWWPHVRAWADYAARLSQVFQAAQPAAQVALMGPTPDVWADAGLDRNAWNTTPWYLHTLWQALSHHGYGSDYVNGTVLLGASVQEGHLRYGPMSYRVLLLNDVASLPPDVTEALRRHAEAGLQVVFVGRVPERSPGLAEAAENDRRVQEAVAAMRALPNVRVEEPPAEDEQVGWAGRLMAALGAPPVAIAEPDPKLYQVHARLGDRPVFFFANVDRERAIRTRVQVEAGPRRPWRWNPETGERTPFSYGDDPHTLDLHLAPLESLLLVFESEVPEAATPPAIARLEATALASDARVIAGPWQVELQPAVGDSQTLMLPDLANLAERSETAAFGGIVRYRTAFRLGRTGYATLDLGAVHETAEVRLNGVSLGTRWWGERTFEIPPDVLRTGENVLEVEVATLLYNLVRALPDAPNADYFLARSERDAPVPAGLLGPVVLR